MVTVCAFQINVTVRSECMLCQRKYRKPLSLKEFDITRVETEITPIHTENRHNMLIRTIPPISLYVRVWYAQEKL